MSDPIVERLLRVQPDPTTPAPPRTCVDVAVERWDLQGSPVEQILRGREALGVARYGTPLVPRNGRDMLADAAQEVADSAIYLAGYAEEGRSERAYALLDRVLCILNDIACVAFVERDERVESAVAS